MNGLPKELCSLAELLPPEATVTISSRGLPAIEFPHYGPPDSFVYEFEPPECQRFSSSAKPAYKCWIDDVEITNNTNHVLPVLRNLVRRQVLDAISLAPTPTTKARWTLPSVSSVDGGTASRSMLASELGYPNSKATLLRLERRLQLTQRALLHS